MVKSKKWEVNRTPVYIGEIRRFASRYNWPALTGKGIDSIRYGDFESIITHHFESISCESSCTIESISTTSMRDNIDSKHEPHEPSFRKDIGSSIHDFDSTNSENFESTQYRFEEPSIRSSWQKMNLGHYAPSIRSVYFETINSKRIQKHCFASIKYHRSNGRIVSIWKIACPLFIPIQERINTRGWS